jgi:hypothetical protein
MLVDNRGTLPVQLLLETLHTIHSILFPSTDPKSSNILNSLIRKRQFDPACAEYDGYVWFTDVPADFTYRYWGDRLNALYEVLDSRPPRNKMEKWLHWFATESNALFVALLALLITIVVGMISIVLAAVQIWISWEAWKHPVCN